MTDHEKMQELSRIKEQAPIALEPEKSALLIIDAQRFFSKPDSPFAQIFERLVPGATSGYFGRVESTVLPNIWRLQECFRARGLPVIFCSFGSFLGDGQDLPQWLKDFDHLGLSLFGQRINPLVNDSNWQIDDRVAPRPGELVLNKNTSGPLNSTKLDQILHNAGINSLVVCGLTTAVCVTQTARELADRGFRVLVAEDACTEMSEEMHRMALFNFSFVFGRVRSTGEVVELIGAAPAAEKISA
jgi:nicotinamidase-related amidase